MEKLKNRLLRKRAAALMLAFVMVVGTVAPYYTSYAAETETATEVSSEAVTEASTETEATSEASSEAVTEPSSESSSETSTETEAVTEAASEATTEEVTEAAAETETESAAETETESIETETETESETIEIDTEETVTDAVTETYIREHLNSKYIKNAGTIKLATGIVVKQTLMNGSLVGRSATIDSIMADDDLKAEAFLGQFETVVALYDLDEDSDYYVGYANTMMNDSSATVTDYAVAEYNTDGVTLSGCFYDKSTGLVYVKKDVTANEDGTILVGYVQLQLLQVIGGYEAGEAVESTSTVGTVVKGDATGSESSESIYDLTTTVEAQAGLAENSVSVSVNGVPLDDDSYTYSSDTGEVVIQQASAAVGTVTVEGKKEGIISKISKAIFGSSSAKAATPDDATAANGSYEISVDSSVKVGTVYDATADFVYSSSGSATGTVYTLNASETEATLKSLADAIISGKNAVVSANVEMYEVSDGGYFHVKLSSLEIDTDDIAFSELADEVVVALKCAHIEEALVAAAGTGHDSSSGNVTSWTMDGGAIKICVLYEGEDSDGKYIILGLVTEKLFTQTGVGLVKLRTSSGQGRLRIRKLYDNLEKVKAINDRYKALGLESPYSRSSALYGVYTTEAAAKNDNANKRVATIKTSPYGWSKTVLLLDEGTYYVREITRSKSGVFLNDEVIEVEIKADKLTKLDDDSSIQFVEPTDTGWGLKKVSGDETITTNNPNYSLAGAEYTVYTDEACTVEATYNAGDAIKLVTDANGDSNEVWVSLSDNFMYDNIDLWVKETKASPGYQLDETVHKIKLKNGNLWIDGEKQDVESGGPFTFTSTEQPKVYEGTNLTLKKISSAPATGKSTAGAIFKVVHSTGTETRTWYFQSKEVLTSGGKTSSESTIEFTSTDVEAGGCLLTSMSDDIYTDASGNLVFPLGTLTITEYQAPDGYIASDASITATIVDGDDPTSASITIDGQTTIEYTLEVEDEIKYGGVKLQKVDENVWEDTQGTDPQGDAALEGATFAIYNANDYAVVTSKDPDTAIEPGEEICRITTVSNIAQTETVEYIEGLSRKYKQLLQADSTYRIVEIDPSTGYKVNDGFDVEFTIPDIENYIYGNTESELLELTCEEAVQRGDVQVIKLDAETGKSEATGGNNHGEDPDASSLSGISFEIRNVSEYPVYLYGDTSQKVSNVDGENLCMTIVSHWNEEEQAYTAETTGKALPYGTYTITETATNESYILGGQSFTFQIREDGTTVYLDENGNAMEFENYVQRQDIMFNKIAEGSNRRLQTAWLLTNNATGEAHVIVTNVNGNYDSATANNPHSNNTNGNDGLLSYDIIPSSKMDSTAGTWFGLGEDGTMAPANDGLRALPYGTYTLTELRSDTNEGYGLVEVTFFVGGRYSNGYSDSYAVVDLGTISDPGDVAISTSAVDKETGEKLASVGETTVIVDTVHCTGLEPGTTYTLRAQIRDYSNESSALMSGGRYVRAEKEFTATSSTMDVEVEISFDATESAGKIGVVFEELYKGSIKVAEHTDIDDEDQRVYLPGVGTKAADGTTGTSTGVNGSTVTIVDTVEYSGLVPGLEYTLRGTVYDKETGTAASSEEEITFTPDSSDGIVEVTFEFTVDSEGKDFVVFEKLYYAETLIASHEDIDDDGQTVHYPGIGTQAKLNTNGLNEGTADGQVTITDTVSYKNLTAGTEYTLKGVLMDKETGKELLISGSTVTAEVTFTPTAADGTVDMEFTFDSSGLDGKDVVVFEKLYYTETLIASHEDLTDEGQTVNFVTIGTEATDSESGGHQAAADESVTIIDKVSYTNLTVGNTYTVKGTLYDKATGQPLTVDGAEVTAETTFTATTADGYVELTFTFDGSALAGDSVVAFEYIYRDGKLVASHTDITDEDQTVDFPELGTTALDKKTGTHQQLAAKNAVIIDTVSYSGLTVGKQYTIKGTLYNKATGKPLKVNGNKVTAEVTFTPEEPDGTVELKFKYNASALAGKTIVVFEDLYSNDALVATHSDINDEDQSIYVVKIGTQAAAKDGGSTLTAGSSVTIVDTVSYTGLVKGEKYTIKGTLMDKSTGKAVKVNGKEVTAEATFTATASSGTAEVEFTFDATGMEGKELVVFEELYDSNGSLLAEHEDINDEAQTVAVAGTSTTPTGTSSGSSATASPKTGDTTDLLPWIIAAVIALIAAASAMIWKRKKKSA